MEGNQNKSPFQFINEEEQKIPSEEQIQIKTDAQTTEDFVTGLPDWDLTPPYEIIRRVSRK